MPGTMCADMDETSTTQPPGTSTSRKASFTYSVPSALASSSCSAEAMWGERPAACTTAVTGPRLAACRARSCTDCLSAMSHAWTVTVMPEARREAAALSSLRSVASDQDHVVVCQELGVARPMPLPPR